MERYFRMKAEGYGSLAISSQSGSISEDDAYVSVREVAKRSSMSEKIIRNFVKDGSLPHYRNSRSGKIWLRWTEFAAFMESRRIEFKNDACLLDILRDMTRKARS